MTKSKPAHYKSIATVDGVVGFFGVSLPGDIPYCLTETSMFHHAQTKRQHGGTTSQMLNLNVLSWNLISMWDPTSQYTMCEKSRHIHVSCRHHV